MSQLDDDLRQAKEQLVECRKEIDLIEDNLFEAACIRYNNLPRLEGEYHYQNLNRIDMLKGKLETLQRKIKECSKETDWLHWDKLDKAEVQDE